jgi:quinol-cytochrome oxidoreductase complex cytochrome b subunit
MSEARKPSWRAWVESTDVYRSIVRTPPIDSPRGRAQRAFGNVFLHVYPVRVPRAILRFRSTFRLGYISTVLFALLLITGTYLMFFYTPAVSMAYGDMERLKTQVGFGQLIRNVHRWGAHLMVLTVVLHLVRVFWDGAYKAPRQFNWVIGVGLLVITLAYSFTGYLLPWDQLAYWAVTVGSDLVHYVPVIGGWLRNVLLGGATIGQSALLRFYVLHVAVLTVFFGVLFSVHIWRVRKDGFAPGTTHQELPEAVTTAPTTSATNGPSRAAEIVPAPAVPVVSATPSRIRLLGHVRVPAESAHARTPDDEVFTWPHLLLRHQVTALATMVVVLAMGIAFDAPLREHANPNLTPEPAKAPWYFVGIQELLAHFDPLVAGVLAPAALVLLLSALPYIDRDDTYRPSDRKVIVSLVMLAGLVAFALTVIGAFFRGPGWAFVLPWEHLYFEP